MQFDSRTYRLTDRGNFGRIAAGAGIVGLVFSGVGYYVDAGQFFFSWLTAVVFWLSIGLGGLFFTMLHHLVGAKWSVVLRRLSENIMSVLPVMALLFIPVLLGLHELFHWSHADAVAADPLLQGKAGYLNITFFVLRLVAYFLIWFVLVYMLNRISAAQDSAYHPSQTRRLRVISAPGIILFAITLTFSAFDWMMSLDAHWYSTIFGVYVFSGSLLAMLSFLTLVVLLLRRNHVLENTITVEHRHDLGKLIFAFTIFWAYMAFSQYFLIWYGNIPEETIWFLHRWDTSWKVVTLLILFGHFVVPFFVLFPHAAKRNPLVLGAMALWILVMHWIDLYWIIMPTLHHHGVHLSWIDPATLVGIGGVFLWYFWRRVASRPLVPIKDPSLEASIRFVNH
ncbi:MAG: hypothetical protein OEW00_00845 [candidate division Zixibacteria bacterium]|nr:hypothetical protein [candidate division Zixibacteria bacterium]